uniref:Globin domain-containing protein n=1 Tax=Ciona savignyi TaxID=51511 RepID=H2ZAE8_CIOSA
MEMNAQEIQDVRDSWKRLCADGEKTVGLMLMQKLFNTYPESIKVFSRLGITNKAIITIDDLSTNSAASRHAESLTSRIGTLVDLMHNTHEFKECSTEVGEIHIKYGVTAEHVDILGNVLLSVICDSQGLSKSSDLYLCWTKTWEGIAKYVKIGLQQ